MHSSYLFINTTGVGMEPMLERSVVPDASYFKPDLKVADNYLSACSYKNAAISKRSGLCNDEW